MAISIRRKVSSQRNLIVSRPSNPAEVPDRKQPSSNYHRDGEIPASVTDIHNLLNKVANVQSLLLERARNDQVTC